MLSVVGVIPARYASHRLPGKPLCDIAGLPMVVRVYRRAIQSGLERVIVATDDRRIVEVCEKYGAEVMMTERSHISGTDRVAEVAKKVDASYYINLQGDEPLIEPKLIDEVIDALRKRHGRVMVSACRSSRDPREIDNPNVVKVVRDREGRALYFSRARIPFSGAVDRTVFHKHIGIYGYSKQALLEFTSLPDCALEKAEKLEQLRALYHGIPIWIVESDYPSIGVDTVEDLQRVRALFMEPRR